MEHDGDVAGRLERDAPLRGVVGDDLRFDLVEAVISAAADAPAAHHEGILPQVAVEIRECRVVGDRDARASTEVTSVKGSVLSRRPLRKLLGLGLKGQSGLPS
jgi:hypothetical protein